MSLILEALKKLERERETPGRGFLVVAHAPWASARGRLARLALVAAGVGAVAGGAAWIVWTALSSRGRPAPVAASPVPATAAPTAAAASTLPPPIWRQASPAPTAATPTRAAAAPVAATPPALAAPAAPEPATLVIAPRAAPANAPLPALRLEAISQQDGEPVAVINGQLVRKGESIEGALVTWIGADAVEVEIAGRRQVLSF